MDGIRKSNSASACRFFAAASQEGHASMKSDHLSTP
jgi:hypothetical protein